MCIPFLQASIMNHQTGQITCAWLPQDFSWMWWVVGVILLFVLWSLIPDRHEQKRDEHADIMMEHYAINQQQIHELYKMMNGKTDESRLDKLNARMKAHEDSIEIAPGEGVYYRRKRK